jgi:hypothetical protein
VPARIVLLHADEGADRGEGERGKEQDASPEQRGRRHAVHDASDRLMGQPAMEARPQQRERQEEHDEPQVAGLEVLPLDQEGERIELHVHIEEVGQEVQVGLVVLGVGRALP